MLAIQNQNQIFGPILEIGVPIPIGEDRITEDAEQRITESGEDRIIE